MQQQAAAVTHDGTPLKTPLEIKKTTKEREGVLVRVDDHVVEQSQGKPWRFVAKLEDPTPGRCFVTALKTLDAPPDLVFASPRECSETEDHLVVELANGQRGGAAWEELRTESDVFRLFSSEFDFDLSRVVADPLEWEFSHGWLKIKSEAGEWLTANSEIISSGDVYAHLSALFDYEPAPFSGDAVDIILERTADAESYSEFLDELLYWVGMDPRLSVRECTVDTQGKVYVNQSRFEGERGVFFGSFVDLDPSRYHTRSEKADDALLEATRETLGDLGDDVNSIDPVVALTRLFDQVARRDPQSLLGISDVQSKGTISTGSWYYENLDMRMVFVPEAISPRDMAEPRTIHEADIIPREKTPSDETVMVFAPPSLADAVEQAREALNEGLPETGPELQTSTILEIATEICSADPGPIRVNEEMLTRAHEFDAERGWKQDEETGASAFEFEQVCMGIPATLHAEVTSVAEFLETSRSRLGCIATVAFLEALANMGVIEPYELGMSVLADPDAYQQKVLQHPSLLGLRAWVEDRNR